MSDLPTNWADIALSEIAQVTSGIGFPNEYQGHTSGDLPFFKVSDISYAVLANRGELKTANHYVSHEVAEKLKGKPLAPGSTVFAKIGEAVRLNRRATVTTPCLIDNNVMAVKAREGVDDRYVHQFLRTIDFGESARSTTVPSLRKGDVEELRFPLAPLAEQKRIADKLDTVLTRVDAVNTRLARVAPLLKRFRQSVLAAATSGRLTEDWRANEEPHWAHLIFSDTVVDSSTGLVRSAADQSLMRDGLVPYLKMNSVGEMWGYQCVDLPGVHCTSEEFARYELKEGDWLFNTRNSVELVGKSCVWNGPAGVVFNNNLLRVRFEPHIHSMWMEVYFRSPTGRDLLNAIKSATTSVAAIYQRSLMNLQVVVPPIDEQAEIVRRVETLFAFADRLEARLAQAQTAATRLTPALLAKAFRGELVPQDPNDEPAAELLRRLAQAPAAASPRKGRKPTSTII